LPYPAADKRRMNRAPPLARMLFRPVNQGPARETAGGTQRTQGRIELWHASLQHTGWWRLLHLLSDEERRRADAYAFERDARRFVVSRAVLRNLLTRFTGIPACECKFRLGQHGKPVLEADIDQPVHFSLSRSKELVSIGFAPHPLGVDIEWLGKAIDIDLLIDRVLSRCEQKAFERLDPADRREAFLQYWTLKEAYLKALGAGLSVPPTMVEVWLGSDQPVGLKSFLGDTRAASRWFLDRMVPQEGYIGALATQGAQWQTTVRAFDTLSLIVDA